MDKIANASKLLVELFKENNYEPIIYKGKKIQRTLVLPIKKKQVITVTFIKNNDLTVGGIEVSIDRGKGYIIINDHKIKHPVFWFDTAPKEFSFKCITKENSGSVMIWNIWKNIRYNNTEAWGGDAGIYVEEISKNELILHCMNGYGDIDFEKLVVRIQLQDADS